MDLWLLTLIDLTTEPAVKVEISTFSLIPDAPDRKNEGRNRGLSEAEIWPTAVQCLTELAAAVKAARGQLRRKEKSAVGSAVDEEGRDISFEQFSCWFGGVLVYSYSEAD